MGEMTRKNEGIRSCMEALRENAFFLPFFHLPSFSSLLSPYGEKDAHFQFSHFKKKNPAQSAQITLTQALLLHLSKNPTILKIPVLKTAEKEKYSEKTKTEDHPLQKRKYRKTLHAIREVLSLWSFFRI